MFERRGGHRRDVYRRISVRDFVFAHTKYGILSVKHDFPLAMLIDVLCFWGFDSFLVLVGKVILAPESIIALRFVVAACAMV